MHPGSPVVVLSLLFACGLQPLQAGEERVPIEWTSTRAATNLVPSRSFGYRSWSTTDGLPQNRINALLQTTDGYLWIATQGGLARFDGRQFEAFSSANVEAFHRDGCLSLVEGRDGAVWIGTVDDIVCYRSNRFERISTGSPHDEGHRINGLCVTPSGQVWAATGLGPGTIENGRFRADPGFYEYLAAYPPGISRTASAIQSDTRGNLFVSAAPGVLRRVAGSNSWERVSPDGEFELFAAPDGTVWGAEPLFFQLTRDGLIHHDARNQQFLEDVRAAACDSAGRIWAASRNRIYEFDGTFTPLRTSQALPGEVNVLLPGREGNLWVGTSAGLVCLAPQLFSSITTANHLVHDDVWSITEAPDGAAWIGTSGGVSRLVNGVLSNFLSSGVPSIFPAAASDQIVLALHSGQVWTTPDGVLCRVWPLPPEFPRGTDGRGVRGIPYFQDDDGSVWVQSSWVPQRGWPLRKWDGTNFETICYTEDGIYSVLRDRSHRLWIGTRGSGILVLDGHSTNRITMADGLTSNFCGPALVEDDGTVWIASNKGLNRWKKGQITRYMVEDGLFEAVVLNVLDDHAGSFWLNGERGIYQVAKDELLAMADHKLSRLHVSRYTEADGLPSSEGNGGRIPNSCRMRDGKLWFPTTRGVALLDPAEVRHDSPLPRATITDITLDGEKIFGAAQGFRGLSSQAIFKPGQGRVLRIAYTAPAFSPNPRFKFQYQLEGQDAAWVEQKEDRFTLYTNLRPGSYRFRVRTISAQGAGSDPAIFSFVIPPHFYETWLFYVLSVAALSGLGAALHFRRLAVQRYILNLERQGALEHERSRIAADIHDTLGADFSRITMLAERLRNGNGTADPVADSIAQTARRMGDSMSELIWATNSRNDSLANLCSYIREHAAETCDSAQINLITDIPTSPAGHVSGFVRHQIYLIVREALNNTIKHAQASEVRLSIALTADVFLFELADNGRGFATDDHSKWNNGQASLRRRAENIRGKLTIESQRGGGTIVCLEVPVEILNPKQTTELTLSS